MIFAVLGVVFLLVLAFALLYYFWAREKYSDSDQNDTDSGESS